MRCKRTTQTGLAKIAAIALGVASLPFVLVPLLPSGTAHELNSPQSMASPIRIAMMHGRGSGTMMGHGMSGSMRRHMYYMRNGLPPAYAGKRNPLTPTANVIRAGAELYRENCASCHGARGLGDGEAGGDLRPRPANLARMINMPMLTDAYLLWSALDGGEQFGSAMPAFKEMLSEEEVWKIITSMQAGFPRSN